MRTALLSKGRALVSHFAEREWSEPIPGEQITFRVRAEQVNGAFAILEAVISPGSGPPLHVHDNEDETFEVLEGSLRFVCQAEVFDAPAGTGVVIPRGTIHTLKNIGDKPARVLVTFTPGGAEGMFEEFTGKTSADIAAVAQRYGCRFVGPSL